MSGKRSGEKKKYDMRVFVTVFNVFPEVRGLPTHDETVPVMVVSFPEMSPLRIPGRISLVYAHPHELTDLVTAAHFLRRSILTGEIIDGLTLITKAVTYGFKIVSPGEGVGVTTIPFVSIDRKETRANRATVCTSRIEAGKAFNIYTSGPTEEDFQSAVERVRSSILGVLKGNLLHNGLSNAMFDSLAV